MIEPVLPYESVLLTGANGFVGRHLLSALRTRLAPGATVHCLDRRGEAPVSLLDTVAVHAFVERSRPDLIIHLAAQSSVAQSTGSAADTWRVNVGGTLNLAEAVAIVSPEAVFAFVSSSEVYGTAFNFGRVDEKTVPTPSSVYARTKRAAEEALADTLGPANRLVIFRPTNHSGPGQDERFVLPSFANQIAKIEAGNLSPVLKVGSLSAERDFLDVRDVVDAYMRVLTEPGTDRCQIYNVSSGHPVPINDILDHLLEMSLTNILVEQDPARMRPSEVPRTDIDSSALRIQTNWAPQFTLRDMVTDVLAAARRRQK